MKKNIADNEARKDRIWYFNGGIKGFFGLIVIIVGILRIW